MADIKSINGNNIVVGTSQIEDGAVTDAKLAQSGGVLSQVNSAKTGFDGSQFSTVGDMVNKQLLRHTWFDINKTAIGYGYLRDVPLQWDAVSVNNSGGDGSDTISISTPNNNKLSPRGNIYVVNDNTTKYRFRYHTYSSNGTYESSTSWYYSGYTTITLDTSKLYRLQIATRDGTTRNFDEYLTHVRFFYADEKYYDTEQYIIDVNMGGSSVPTFSRDGNTLTVTFAENDVLYATDRHGKSVAVHTFSQQESYECTTTRVLVWDTTTDTVSVIGASATRNERTIPLLYNQYHVVYYGALKPYYDEWLTDKKLSTKADVDSLPTEESLPSYYDDDDYWSNKISAVKSASNALNAGGASFAFITDMHMGRNRGWSRLMLRDVLRDTSVPFVLFGGDIPTAYGTQAERDAQIDSYWSYLATIGKNNWFSAHGNHDIKTTASAEDDTHYIAPYETCYNVQRRNTERLAIGPRGKLYYHIEDAQNKIRIIVVDDFEDYDTSDNVNNYISSEQLAWVESTILDAEGYDVLVITHAPIDSAMYGYVSTSESLHTLLVAAKNKSGVFSDWTGDIVACISGHSHRDESHVSGGLLCISTTCDAWYNNDPNVARSANSITEQAFDVYFVNTDAKTISTVRCGAGSNRSWSY